MWRHWCGITGVASLVWPIVLYRSIYINLLLTMYCLKPWPDHAIKREINRLLVKCHYHEMGCEWKGLFKDLIVSCFIYYEHVDSLYYYRINTCQVVSTSQWSVGTLDVVIEYYCLN